MIGIICIENTSLNYCETREQFLWCANRAAEFCWDNTDYKQCCTNKRKAQAALYDELREHTDLTANLVIGAIYRQ